MKKLTYSLLTLALAGLGVAGGYWLGHGGTAMSAAADGAKKERPALYWFDPMYPTQHFNAPGKSPFMDMQLVPKYVDGVEDTSSISVSPQLAQNLGMRTAVVVRERLPGGLDAVGSLGYNQRDIANLQARAAGFVERVYDRAPGDVLPAGAPLVDLLIPEWSAAQLEFVAVLASGDSRLIQASRQRLQLLGMPEAVIAQVAKTRTVRPVLTLTTPIAGELQSLEVRAGMSVSAGMSLARINGLGSVWLDSAIPEAQATLVQVGAPVSVALSAYPAQTLTGKVVAILPSVDPQNRTLTVRSQLPNPDGKLRPGMFASVRLADPDPTPSLLVPSEAVIRTGKRTLVMLAGDQGRYKPLEVRIGRESAGRIEVLDGLSEGQKVVTSGQFLLDSEASLQGIVPTDEAMAPMARMDATDSMEGMK
ncbi:MULTISPECIES: efflux RND transporter periplasmic adaptor subunit [unclassified Pseudomonas]|jgi:Cu(I)/Ag(I) efflux system membrane fusion protein|uniref:efflux RND transporter periplasmic adaptor subunit n=1 Tax=unclassified Pseudomonas TaxID=196821 RepID=UPI000C2FA5C3|nr:MULTISPECIES: efflux RND transporter periplasmic adaptor subunit [unclassified Pseudomonas]MCU1736013.1 efflux RND transporter periplasmic adaptor subunit [Pseudomonas sp. 20S_6.2_Bac1]